jgi:hypothetical protein
VVTNTAEMSSVCWYFGCIVASAKYDGIAAIFEWRMKRIAIKWLVSASLINISSEIEERINEIYK